MSIDPTIKNINSGVNTTSQNIQNDQKSNKKDSSAEKTSAAAASSISTAASATSSVISVQRPTTSTSAASAANSCSTAASDMKNLLTEHHKKIQSSENGSLFRFFPKEFEILNDLNTPKEIINLILSYNSEQDFKILKIYYDAMLDLFKIKRKLGHTINDDEEYSVYRMSDKIDDLLINFITKTRSVPDLSDSLEMLKNLKKYYEAEVEKFSTKRKEGQNVNEDEEFFVVTVSDKITDLIIEILRSQAGWIAEMPSSLIAANASNTAAAGTEANSSAASSDEKTNSDKHFVIQ